MSSDLLDDQKVAEYVSFQIKRNVTALFKQFLVTLEDIRADPTNLSHATFDRYRKKVLDAGNDTIREIERNLERVKMTLK